MNKFYPEIIEKYFDEQISFKVLWYDNVHSFKISQIDFSFDSAIIICEDEGFENLTQATSLSHLENILLSKEIPPLRYIYVNRWYDEENIPHYFGVYSTQPTIKLAQKYTKFNIIDCDIDLIYQAKDEKDMFDYMADVNLNNQDNNDERI